MPETTTAIDLAFPDADELKLRISVGACTLSIAPGAAGWAEGTYHDPSGRIPIAVEEQGGSARIRQAPDVESVLGLFQGSPTLELRLGSARPFALVVEGGANEFELELGGVPLTGFDLRHGAGKIELGFSQPNPVEMERMHFATGAGSLEAEGLANANFAKLVAEGGASKFELGFGGELRRAGSARITTGASGVEIEVPATTAAKVAAKTTLGSIEVGSGFVTHEGEYWTREAEAGGMPVLDIEARVAVGSFKLASS